MGSIDTQLHPHPTGRAASYASSHSSSNPLILYGGWFCPFVQRAWLVLHEKNIPHQYIEINPYKKEADFLALNPRGLVPTLAVPMSPGARKGKEQKPLYESSVICEYLDEVYADPSKYGNRLLPEDAYERARCRIWIDHIATRIVPSFYRFMQHTPEKDGQYTLDEARQEFVGHIKTWIKEADATGPYWGGEEIGLVDIMLAPWLVRLFLLDHYKGGTGIPGEDEVEVAAGKEGGENADVWKRWHVWAKAVGNRDSVLDTMSDREHYIDVYKRYADDTTQSEVAKATRKGRGLP